MTKQIMRLALVAAALLSLWQLSSPNLIAGTEKSADEKSASADPGV